MAENRNHSTTIGWAATFLGCALWTYGYFTTGSLPFIDWPLFAPHWFAEYIPNWQAEVGLALTTLGSLPVYYAQIQEYRQRP